MAGRVKAHVGWSIYVETSNRRDLKEVHLPPIATALQSVEFVWDISTEKEAPGLFRVVTYQNLEGGSVEDIVITVLRRAYRLLRVEWTISGLEDLDAGELEHIYGYCYIRPPPKTPPSIESVLFDIEPGHIRRVPRKEAAAAGWLRGAWRLIDEPSQRRKRKPRVSGQPEPSDEIVAYRFGKPGKPKSPSRPAPPDAQDESP